MVVNKRILFNILLNSCHFKIKNNITPKATKNPLLLLAKRREKVRKKAEKRVRKKTTITTSDSGAKKDKTANQTIQKKIAKKRVGKKFLLLLFIDFILINLMI